MLTYKRPQMLARAISSVLGQSFQAWELLVVQDGDTPETGRLVQEWSEKEDRIRYFRRHTIGPITEASNFGLSHARGEYIAILDDDDSWRDPDKLAHQVAFLDTHPEYVACGGGYSVSDENGRFHGVFFKPEHDSAIRARALLANPIANSTAVFRRVVSGTPVTYDGSMRQFADWDFWLSMGSLGKLYNSPVLTTDYTLWKGGSSFQNQRGNALAAIRIICKHRRQYSGFPLALVLASLYFCYTCLPLPVRRFSYNRLSALKKAVAGATADA